jgi:diguanylate cyclase (GGDEF)-like protein
MELYILILANIVLVLEMLYINVFATLSCTGKKRSDFANWFYLTLFTAVIFTLSWSLFPQEIITHLNANCRHLTLIGFIYVLPAYFLSKQPFRQLFVVFNIFWIYSLILNAISIRLAYIFYNMYYSYWTVGIQTFLYIISLPIIIKFMRQKLIFTIRNIKHGALNEILALTAAVVVLLYAEKHVFESGTTVFLESLIFLLIGLCFILTFRLTYSFVDASASVEILGIKSKTDPLTRLKNREAMLEDAALRMEKGMPFCLIFLDLDNFKTINDTYGHNIGDDYLVAFSNSARMFLDEEDRLYRISGDEFVILKSGGMCQDTCFNFENMEFLNNPSGISFLGLSTGFSKYPDDSNNINELLGIADSNMYQAKKEKHKKQLE